MKTKEAKYSFDRGQSVIEFALIIPVIVLLLAGIFDFGLYFLTSHEVQNAVREGARHAIALTNLVENDPRVIDHVELVLPDTGLYTSYEDGITNTVPDCDADGDVTVRVAGTFNFTFLGILGFDDIGMNVPTSMRHESCGSGAYIPGTGGSGGGGTSIGGTTICYALTTDHTGSGEDPVFSPSRSDECITGYFVEDAVVSLTANPDLYWEVDSWLETDDDALRSNDNQITMPAADTNVTVNYVLVPCYTLSLSKTGNGDVPTAPPTGAPHCESGEYVGGEWIELDAEPDYYHGVSGWTGTDNNNTTSETNSLTMPHSDHAASVSYELLVCYELTTSHTGSGIDPNPSAATCPDGLYREDTVVALNAWASAGWEVTGWTNTNNDSSTTSPNYVTMTSDKAVSVTYEEEPIIPPPYAYEVYASGWYWDNYRRECRGIDLRYDNYDRDHVWDENPIKFEVFKNGYSYGYDTDGHWNINFSIDNYQYITLGVRAVFVGGVVSQTQNITYRCYWGNLYFIGREVTD